VKNLKEKFPHLPQNERKKILLICDDIRVHSGVATVAREIVIHTSHHFNWVNIAGAIKHPEVGKRMEISNDINNQIGIIDASCIIYPVNGYGDANILRQILNIEKPDALMIITDPRYFVWLFQIENEIRKKIPITYLNIWDDFPAPMYNRPYYEACDLLMSISKQTKLINEIVLDEKADGKVLKYVPHGLNEKFYFPIQEKSEEFEKLQKMKNSLFKGKNPKFVLFFNSRNIRRKQIQDTILSFRVFLDSLPREEALQCYLVLHTEIISNAGTDLETVREYFLEENYPNQLIFSTAKLPIEQLNMLYNIADVQILLTSNEGWGLTITEAMLTGTPFIANVTGGMQDQMRFEDENGNWFTPNREIPSNHRKTFTKHGEWVFPVYPSNRSIQGSPPTPYIFDDRCNWEDVVEQLKKLYKMDPEERKLAGLKGREWAISDEAGFTSKHQAQRVMEAFDELFRTWKPREKYEIINATEFRGRFLKHNIIY
jgi:glycosyltransferase involved in cell wall biosynthesis